MVMLQFNAELRLCVKIVCFMGLPQWWKHWYCIFQLAVSGYWELYYGQLAAVAQLICSITSLMFFVSSLASRSGRTSNFFFSSLASKPGICRI